MQRAVIRAHGAVVGAVLAFAALVNWAGLVPAVFVCVLVASQGTSRQSVVRALASATLMAVAVAALFVGLLGQPLSLIGGR